MSGVISLLGSLLAPVMTTVGGSLSWLVLTLERHRVLVCEFVSPCACLYNSCMCVCVDSQKFQGIALVLTALHINTLIRHQTVQKPHHRRLQCPPPLPRCTSPKQMRTQTRTGTNAHTNEHITTGSLPCLLTLIHMLRPRGPMAMHSAYYRGCM